METLFIIAALLNNVDPDLLGAICYVESKHNVYAYNSSDGNSPSYGICQVKFGTAKGLGFKGTNRDLQDPRTNSFWSARYLQYLSRKTRNNMHNTVSAYNCGRPRGVTPYVRKVMAEYERRKQKNLSMWLRVQTAQIHPVSILVLPKVQNRSND